MATTIALTAFNLNLENSACFFEFDLKKDSTLAPTLLHQVIREGDLLTAEALHASGININQADEVGKRPLHEAAFFGHEDIVRFLISEKAIIDAPLPILGHTPLFMSVQERHLQIAQFLISKGANILVEDGLSGDGLLHLAAKNNDMPMVGALLKNGINVFKENRYGQTARDIAARSGHKELEKTLLKVMQHHARH
jgi:ankyrin repeat protein